METSSSREIDEGTRGQNLLFEGVDSLDGNHRFPKFVEFLCQVATESDEGKSACLERPANAAGFLQEFYISSWQHELAQRLWWQVSNLFKDGHTEPYLELLNERVIFRLSTVRQGPLCRDCSLQDLYEPRNRQALTR